MSRSHPPRLMWIVNHKTLLPAEVPILRNLGYEVFIPKTVPTDEAYRSGVVTYDYDCSLTISKRALDILNSQDFYGRPWLYRNWSPTLRQIINDNFDVVISTVSSFVSPLREAVRHFDGLVVARTFGLTNGHTYESLLTWLGYPDLPDDMARRGSRYVFGQGYSNLAEIEPAGLGANAHTVTVPLPDSFFEASNTWTGQGDKAVLVCPGILETGYYRDVYTTIKKDFGDLPHVIFGRQSLQLGDPAVLPYLTDSQLLELYQQTPVFIYPSVETRHIHYSPIEAMVVGAPVLYRTGSLSDMLNDGAPSAGACASNAEMHHKASRLIQGDQALADAIRAGQGPIVDSFRVDLARRQWEELLRPHSS